MWGDNIFLSNSTFNNNSGTNGGAILWNGKNGTVSNSTFNNNIARMYGGAIRWEGANGALSNSTFNSNNATECGGAITWNSANGTLSNSTFNSNNASKDGGAILCTGKSSAISNSTFTNNKARNGGAIEWGGEYGNVTSCLFVNNTATTNGSVYHNDFSRYSYSNFTNNILLNNGPGEIYYIVFNGSNADYNWFGNNEINYNQKPYDNSNTWLFINGTVNPNMIGLSDISEITFKLYSYDGSEIREYDNSILYPINLSLSTTRGTLSKDTARLSEIFTFQGDSGGKTAISAKVEDVQSDITIIVRDGTSFWDLNRTINGNNNTEITLNKNYTYNPEIDSDFINGIIINRTLTINGNKNTINGSDLARIFNIIADDVIIDNIIFTNGNADTGGAIYWEGDYGTLSNSTFNNNNASEYGGAIYWNGVNNTVSNSIFNSNTAYLGGAIYWESRESENGTISNSTFNNNTAKNFGGAICWYGNYGTVSNSTFNNNTAENQAGAIQWNGKNGVLNNSTFNNNTARNQG